MYHSLIRAVLIQSCSAGAKNFTSNYLFCHPQFSGVIQNIENCCAIRAKFLNSILEYKIDFLIIIDIDKQGSKWHNDFQYFG